MMRFDAYYYSFVPTGQEAVDVILSAVACAGKAFHHTEGWQEEWPPSEPHTGDSPVRWIQNAASSAAKEIEALRADLVKAQERTAKLQEALERLRAENDLLTRALNSVDGATVSGGRHDPSRFDP